MFQQHLETDRTGSVASRSIEAPLCELANSEVNVAILRRKVPSGVQRELEAWARGKKRSAQGTFDVMGAASLSLPEGLSTRTFRG